MSNNSKLLIETNPIAYEELIEFKPESGGNAYAKGTLPCDTQNYFGEWKCPSKKHTWLSTIRYRSHQQSDPGCPICKNQKLNLNPTLYAHRFHYTNYRTWVEGLWYCKNCYAFYWAKDTEDMYKFEYHNEMQCTPGAESFEEKFPEIAKRWSDKNFVSSNKIQYNYENDFKFLWDCQTCGMTYKASMYHAVNLKVACPYCSGRIPLPKYSFATLYPKLAASWNYTLTQERSSQVGIDEELTPETAFPDNRSYGYFTCPDCGVIRCMGIGDLIAEERCPHCAAGMTKDYTEKLYKGFGVEPTQYLRPTQKKATFFRCQDCNQHSYIKPIEAFFMKKSCKYCSGDIAIPGKTSFKALYPEIEKELIYDERVDIDTDKVTYKYSNQKTLNWKCEECQMIWSATIYDRATGKRTCPYCKGDLAIPGKTSFKALYPEIEKELIYDERVDFNTDLITPKQLSSKLLNWECHKCNMIWKSNIIDRVNGIRTCPYCAGEKPHPEKTSLYAKYTKLVEMEWKYQNNVLLVDPQMEFPTSPKQAWWKCMYCHKSYKTSIKKRVRDYLRSRNSCTYCNGFTHTKFRN